MTLLKPTWTQPTGADPTLYYPGTELRLFAQAFLGMEGVFGPAGLLVAQRAAGANFSVDIAAGQCVVIGNDIASQGAYVCTNTAGAYNLVTPGAPGSGTRYHRVVAQVRDKTCNGSWTTYDWIPVLVQDTGAGLPAEPPSSVSLAQVAITTGQVSVLNANITDLRPIIQPLQPYQGSQIYVAAGEGTASTGYTDLTTPGPACTVTTGTKARVTVSSFIVASGTYWAFMGFAISGATTIAASDAYSLRAYAGVTGAGIQASATYLIPGLTPGSNTFTAKYRTVSPATGTFSMRYILVEPV